MLFIQRYDPLYYRTVFHAYADNSHLNGASISYTHDKGHMPAAVSGSSDDLEGVSFRVRGESKRCFHHCRAERVAGPAFGEGRAIVASNHQSTRTGHTFVIVLPKGVGLIENQQAYHVDRIRMVGSLVSHCKQEGFSRHAELISEVGAMRAHMPYLRDALADEIGIFEEREEAHGIPLVLVMEALMLSIT